MARKKKTYVTRPTDSLWGSIRLVGWIFILTAAGSSAAYVYRALLLQTMDPSMFLRELDVIPGQEAELWLIAALSLLLILSYVVGAFLVLRWYLRAIRNAHVLHRGIETSPGWAIWNFVVPVISLFRPYTMTSELWRASHRPEGWKGLRDPMILRWWWGLLLVAGLASIIGNAISQSADTAGVLTLAAWITAAVFVGQAIAGLLFMKIGGTISRLQTELVRANHRPAESTTPSWSA